MALKPHERIEVLSTLGQYLKKNLEDLNALFEKAYSSNQWFTPDNSRQALLAICKEYLDHKKLTSWSSQYDLDRDPSKAVALVLAGNIPMVGFHDLLSSFISGHRTMMKFSSKDDVLIPGILKILGKLEPRTIPYFQRVENLKQFDAVIATGGNAAATHFKYYFSKYPHIIRQNRNSVAVLNGQERPEELHLLGQDVFDYFGLGCRSVSKIYLPEGFNTDRLFEAFYSFAEIVNHNKYKNNFDYNHAIFLLGQEPFLTNDVVILKEDKKIASRIACVHYETYKTEKEVMSELNAHAMEIQCVSSNMNWKVEGLVPLGQCQKPGLNDYADGVDTMQFLTGLTSH